MSTKYCFVLSCANNSKKNPEKHFFYVPQKQIVRERWCDAVQRIPASMGRNTTFYCCIDHFNIDDDFEDVADPSMNLKLKAGVIPCLKRLNDLSDSIVSYTSHVSKSTETSKESSALASSMSVSSYEDSDSDWQPSNETSFEYDADNITDSIRDLANRKQELLSKTELVKNFFGIEFRKMFLVDVIVEETSLSKAHILMCLQKIKQNLSFAVLSFDYALSISQLGRIFNKTIRVMAKALEKFVVWSDKAVVEHRLPNEVTSIINCFEIQIQRPTNAVHQSHTWSQYKQCNTIKYLVSSTPDGIVNFISKGFGGRIPDLDIVKYSGYLDVLPANSVVMADRGFKSIETILATKNCRLIPSPSVSVGENMPAEDVHFTEQVAALRIHIESVIKRYREFAILLPHATVNTHLIASINEILIVVSALINIQSTFIK